MDRGAVDVRASGYTSTHIQAKSFPTQSLTWHGKLTGNPKWAILFQTLTNALRTLLDMGVPTSTVVHARSYSGPNLSMINRK